MWKSIQLLPISIGLVGYVDYWTIRKLMIFAERMDPLVRPIPQMIFRYPGGNKLGRRSVFVSEM